MKNFMMAIALSAFLMIGGTAFANGNHNKNSHDGQEQGQELNNTNSNSNRNTNTIINGQSQGQEQGQLQVQAQAQVQGQLQGQAQDQANVQETNITQIVERDYHNAPEINTPGQMNNYSPSERNYNVGKIGNMLFLKSTWNRYQLKKMLDGNYSMKSVKKDLNGYLVNTDDQNAEIDIVLMVPKGKYDLFGTVIVKGDTGDTTFDVLLKAAIDALDMGANTLLVSGEGAGRVLKGFSWGIGLNASSAKMQGGDSQVTTGGIGVSGGSSEYKSEPWVQTFAIYVYNK